MKQAYVISAYKLPEQLVRLVKKINNENTIILIHVDKNSNNDYMDADIFLTSGPDVRRDYVNIKVNILGEKLKTFPNLIFCFNNVFGDSDIFVAFYLFCNRIPFFKKPIPRHIFASMTCENFARFVDNIICSTKRVAAWPAFHVIPEKRNYFNILNFVHIFI